MHLTTTLAPWSSHDTQLILSCVLGLALIIVFISVLKLAPFLSILVGTFAAGFSAGLPLEAVASAFSKGAGALLGDVGIIIALGAMLGALMAESGAADRLVSTILKHSTPRTLPWMMALVAIIVGLPLFFEVGLVMMVPIIFVMARRSQQPILRIAIPALAGMTTLHALLPPHPGPLIAVSALHADLGLTLGLGLIVAIPAVILAGPVYGIWLSKRMHVVEPEEMGNLFTAHQNTGEPPSFAISLITILLPVVLMLGRTVAKLLLHPETFLFNALNFLGEPLVALGLTVLFAVVALGWSRGMARDRVSGILRKSLPPIAALLLIGAGGGLKQALVVAGISTTIGKIAIGAHMPLILLAWLIAVALRQATGSATVATTTTAGIVAPVVAGLSTTHNSLLALAIGAGSVFFCHVNDAGFWMVREYFGLQLKQTVMVWSVLQTIASVVGLVLTFALWTMLT
ncbi:GntT/GntP/DsdX family permease [Paraburkholderia elongata]|uniref:Gluconate transporter n=1 Tax=Paraburkholderia elongata TaxID=2675747 RepID=A0A972SLQ0_9BURK|nr:gluconate:H+ symporter [Paraburkholderia elongata]NPT59367.1 gluconate transporter [Paraburkholderia elongata]